MARTVGSPVFIDTNVLVYAALSRSALNLTAKNRLKTLGQQGVPLWIRRQVLREFLAVMTRPGELTEELPVAALIEVARYLEGHFLIAEDSSRVTERLLGLMEQISVGGKQVHDANIVATMLAHGVPNLLTHNTADFMRYSGLITILPLE